MVTVYAGAAFVIIELINNITEPLRLPEWTPTLVIVLLAIGFPIVIIFSWIYDIHPEGGMVKTVPAYKVKTEDIPKSSNGWKIASYISFVVIVGLILLNIVPRAKGAQETADLEKSIAVLPFESLSVDPELQYQADGVMDAILLHLSKIKDLRVMSRTSVEQYRDTKKTIPEICGEMGVSYVLEGSFQKSGNQIRLIVQLIQAGMEGHIWANNYDREWKDIFNVQSEVAEKVARELQAVITSEEMERIEKVPTTSLNADDFYKQGKAQFSLYEMDKSNKGVLDKAEKLYHRALEFDSTYALAYAGLAEIYSEKHLWEGFVSENVLDSQLILANKALRYDPHLSEAYDLRGSYFFVNGKTDLAIKEYDRALQYNPNDWRAYRGKMWVYYNDDLLLAIENGVRAVALRGGGSELPKYIRSLGNQFFIAGFPDLAIEQYKDALELDGDSSYYFNGLAAVASSQGNYIQQIEYELIAYSLDTLNTEILNRLFQAYQMIGQFNESLLYCEKYIRRINELGELGLSLSHRIGYTYDNIGDHKSAGYYFNRELEYSNSMIKRRGGRDMIPAYMYHAYYDRAGVYAYQGEEELAMQDLRIFNQMEKMPKWMVTLINNDPLLDNLRDEPEFKQIVREVEAKYQAEHERVRKWLEENDLL